MTELSERADSRVGLRLSLFFAVTGDSVVQIKIDNVIVDEHIVVVLYAWRIKQFDEDALLHDVLSFCVLYQYVLM